MKTCGIIGGMSWESSAEYYKLINEMINIKLGNLHSGKIILYSVDFEEIANLQKINNWQKSAEILSKAAISLENTGADFVMIATNTMHKVAEDVANSIKIPLIDIREVSVEAVKNARIKKVLLLGTKFTMEDDFYKNYLKNRGIEVEIPKESDRNYIHDVIFNKLCLGIVDEKDKEKFKQIIENSDSQGVILGCTEIGMLIKEGDISKKVFDTTLLHAKKAVELMV
ncbi:aspartate/glutamate racemase family protein [Caminibacter sp.]